MWHASAHIPGSIIVWPLLEKLAHDALDGVGDASLGEWRERGNTAFHLRRRLSAVEQESVGPAVDIRGTPEYDKRVAAVRASPWGRDLPPGPLP